MEPSDSIPWLVRVEFQRIQTFLFAVPRLRAMLGANALLGHAIRAELPRLAERHGALSLPPPQSVVLSFAKGDPLAPAGRPGAIWYGPDNPDTALDHGILSRDGGHLRVAFPDQPSAQAFAAVASGFLARRFPDLLFTVEPFMAGTRPGGRSALAGSRVHDTADLPQLQVCTRSGVGVAAAVDPARRGEGKDAYVSAAAVIKEEAGERLQKGQGTSFDYITLLRDHMSSGACERPPDLASLADAGGYLALVHADGNQVGRRVNALDGKLKGRDWLERECAVEAFFHRMRGAVRSALMTALDQVFLPEVQRLQTEDHNQLEPRFLPYQLLMLGGDDLLLLCHPRHALPFVREYARALAVQPLGDDEPLSIGVGVIIAKASLPFHRLHQLAEALATSAKRAYLQLPPGAKEPPQRSVVDWAVLTGSWGDDPLAARGRHDLVRYGDAVQALSAKPYFVLDRDAAPGQVTLEALLSAVEALEGIPELPRSQLKGLLRELEGGEEWARLAYLETLEILERRAPKAREVIAALVGADSPWAPPAAPDGPRLTLLKDLIECLELRFLGRRKQALRGQQEVSHV